jgi:tRNA threonylcarbamoyladenosine biosynthesis protein TsaB
MSKFLLIESSSINCSVAIAKDEKIVASKDVIEENIHASALTVFIDNLCKESNISLKDIDAVVLGKGPGSYTGLRIGASVAKGICYALDKKLISCSSLTSMFEQAKINMSGDYVYIPLIDARRMEVYTCVYSSDGSLVEDVQAKIIDQDSFNHLTAKGPIVLFGSGAEKCKQFLLGKPDVYFIEDVYPSAKFLLNEAIHKNKISDIENVAYFEPFYLKDFYIK